MGLTVEQRQLMRWVKVGCHLDHGRALSSTPGSPEMGKASWQLRRNANGVETFTQWEPGPFFTCPTPLTPWGVAGPGSLDLPVRASGTVPDPTAHYVVTSSPIPGERFRSDHFGIGTRTVTWSRLSGRHGSPMALDGLARCLAPNLLPGTIGLSHQPMNPYVHEHDGFVSSHEGFERSL